MGWKGKILLVLIGAAGGVILLEAGLRIAGISYPSFYTLDEYSCTAHRPGAEGLYSAEGGAYVRINSAGLRDREHASEKAPGTYRIAVLGDSYAAAYEVSIESTFWSVMEQELAGYDALAGRKPEVINFGVAGYGTAQELMTLRHRAWEFDPDIIVLALTTDNDVRNNSRELDQDPLRPYFVYEDSELVLDSSCEDSSSYQVRQTWYAQLGYRIVNSSFVLQLLNEAKNALKVYGLENRRDDRAIPGLSNELGLDDTIYVEPVDDTWAEAWQVTEGLIALMNDEVRAKGAEFLVVIVSNPIQVHPDPSVRESYMSELGISSLFYPNRRIIEFGKTNGIQVLDLAQPLQAYAQEEQVFLHGFENTALGRGHWNSEGHRISGQLIAREIFSRFITEQ